MRVIASDAFAVVTIYMEGAGEPFEFKVAVAETLLTRMTEGVASDGTIEDTVTRPFQYSGWNTKSPERKRCLMIDDDDDAVKDCQKAWILAQSKTTNYSNHATHYFSPKSMVPPGSVPSWVDSMDQVAEVHGSLFYRPKAN